MKCDHLQYCNQCKSAARVVRHPDADEMNARADKAEARIAELETQRDAALDDARRSHNMIAAFQSEMMEIRNLLRRAFKIAGGKDDGEG